jgi:enoyl-CoA hydratase/carnithine racemase
MHEIGSVIVRQQSRVGWITLNRPEGYNAIKGEMITSMHAAMDWAETQRDMLALMITGAGNYFCAGGDLNQFKAGWEQNAKRQPTEASSDVRTMLDELGRLAARIRLFPWPVVAVINGPAVGAGFAMAVGCDMRIAARHVKFSIGFARVGASAATMGLTQNLPRLVGPAVALQMMVTGTSFTAEEALQRGLLNKVADREQLEPMAQEFGEEIARQPPLSIRTSKRAMYQHMGAAYDQVLSHEALLQTQCLLSKDHYEGVLAVLEKRSPRFAGA